MPAIHRTLRLASDPALTTPGVWHGDAMGSLEQAVQPTGHALLNAQLPGGGWPVGAMSEVLQPQAGWLEWQLVLPALAQATACRAGAVVLVAPPYEPFGAVLQAYGLPPGRLCVVRSTGASALWAAEQALRCPGVLGVMAWLPQVAPAALRRLQLAAAAQGQLLWVFRPASAAQQASPALLRLQVQGAWQPQMGGAAHAGAPAMQVHILKRRGPPLVHGFHLPGCAPALAQVLAAQAQRQRARSGAVPAVRPVSLSGVLVRSVGAPLPAAHAGAAFLDEGRGHALDGVATAVA